MAGVAGLVKIAADDEEEEEEEEEVLESEQGGAGGGRAVRVGPVRVADDRRSVDGAPR